ncbi:hypothetical protein HYV70_02080 [Candidatus Uhrbacteria bacterium]|nr:hypothetical protein [Candidatus Uhrbacteria bacterium]
MALADTFSKKISEREEQEARQKREEKAAQEQAEALKTQEAEQSHLESLRQSIGMIDSRLESMRTLLTELTQTHEKAGVSVAGAKKEGKALTKATSELEKLFENEQFHAILEDEGISSLEDLLNAQQYSEESEIKTVKQSRESRTTKRQTARESIAARRSAKEKVHAALSLDTLTYPSVANALERAIQELEQERKTVFDQTPEGQEVIRTEMFERVRQQYELRGSWDGLASGFKLDRQILIVGDDLEDAKKYGEGKVKSVIKEYYGQVIDRDLQKEAKRDGVIQLQEAVETIESLPRRWNEVSDRLQQVRQEKQKTIDRLNSLLGTDSGVTLLKQVKAYEQWGDKKLDGLAEAFVDGQEMLSASRLGLRESQKTPIDLLEKMIVDQEHLLDQFRRGDSKKVFSNRDASSQYFSPNDRPFPSLLAKPKRVERILDELENFYQKFQEILALPQPEVVKKIRDAELVSDLAVTSEQALALDHSGISHYLTFDAKTYVALRDSKFEEVKTRLQKEQQAIEKKRTQLKEQLSDKVDADWDQEQLSNFVYREKNDGIIALAESRIRLQELAQAFSSELDIAMVRLQGSLHQEVVMNQNKNIEFVVASGEDLEALNKNSSSLKTEITEKKELIKKLTQEISDAKGWLHARTRGKKETEKQTLENELSSLQLRFESAQTEYVEKIRLDKLLEELRTTLHDVRGILPLEAPSTPVPLQEFIETVQKQLIIKLTPTQSSVREQYQTLVKKRDETKNTYQKRWGSSISR